MTNRSPLSLDRLTTSALAFVACLTTTVHDAQQATGSSAHLLHALALDEAREAHDALEAVEAVLATHDPESWLAIDTADTLASLRREWREAVYALDETPAVVASIVRAA